MTTLIIVLVVGVVVWLFLSQFIAWIIAGPDQEQVLELWAGVFLMPILLIMLLFAILEKFVRMLIHLSGLARRPDDDPMEYFP